MYVFIGHDSSQSINTEVCIASIRKYNKHINIVPLVKQELEARGFCRVSDGSTEFTYTRFLVPYLMNYKGYALFCDSDFVWLCDPEELLKYADPSVAVSCVKHPVMPVRSSQKMDNKKNEYYPRKWWSSLMLFNCGHPSNKGLTIDAVNTLSASALHRMTWAKERIGTLPVSYNYLVGYYSRGISPKALHFTDGTPLHNNYKNESFSENYLEFVRRTK